jgi:hypothetical protein
MRRVINTEKKAKMKKKSRGEKSEGKPDGKTSNPTFEFVRLLAIQVVQKLRSLQETDSQKTPTGVAEPDPNG